MSSTLPLKKILYIAPVFYNYQTEIYDELVKKNFDVTSIFYFYESRYLSWNARKETAKINEQINKIAKTIKEERFDILFVIKGEILNKSLIDEFKVNNKNSKTINYQWDSIKNLTIDFEFINAFDYKYTFDYVDSINYPELGLIFKPLFFSPVFYRHHASQDHYDIATVGGMQLNRVGLIRIIQKKIPEFRYKILLRTKISLNLPFNLFKFGFFSYLKYALYKDLSKLETAHILSKSRAILDISNSNQTGLSMRSIETLALKKKLITTNTYIVNYDFYHPSNVLVLNQSNISEITDFMRKPFLENSSSLISKYSISNWVDTILNQKNELYLMPDDKPELAKYQDESK